METINLKILTSGLLLVSCFFVPAYGQIYQCGINNKYIKPVFFNGMSTSAPEARETSLDTYNKVKAVYNKNYEGEMSPKVNDYYAAINEESTWQFVDAIFEYFYFFNKDPSYQSSPEEGETIGRKLVNWRLNRNQDYTTMRDDILKYKDDGYNFVFTAHSQGTMKINALYEDAIGNWDPNTFGYVSIGAAATPLDPNTFMIMQEDDGIRHLGGMTPFYGEKFNSRNSYFIEGTKKSYKDESDYKGHSVISYLYGDDTSWRMDTGYKFALDRIKLHTDSLGDSDGNLEFNIFATGSWEPVYPDLPFKGSMDISVSESYYSSAISTTPDSIGYKDTTGLEINPIKGSFERVESPDGEDWIKYSMPTNCDEMPDKMKLSFKAWNHYPEKEMFSQVWFESNKLDLGDNNGTDYVLSYIKPKAGSTLTEEDKKGKDTEKLQGVFFPIGYEVTFTRTEYDKSIFNVDLKRVYPEYDKTIEVKIKDHSGMGSLYVCEIHTRYEGGGGRTFYKYCKSLKGKNSDIYTGSGIIPENQYEYKGNDIAGNITKVGGEYIYTLSHDSYMTFNYPGYTDDPESYPRGNLERVTIHTRALEVKDEDGYTNYENYRTSASVKSDWLDLNYSESSDYSDYLWFTVEADGASYHGFD